MSAILEKKENSVVVLTMEATKEEFAQAVQKSFVKNKNRFQIPGFRKGKAPFQLVKKYYGEGVLYDDAVDFIVNEGYRAAIEEHNLEVVSKPEMDIVDISPETGMKYTVTVTVKPEVVLGKYLGVSAHYHHHEPGPDEVDKEIERIRERNARLIAVEDRPIREGDTVTIDYEGFVDGIAFEGGKAEGYDLKIGSDSFIPGFEEQLIGHSLNENFSITVTFPEEYHSEELKGKEATFAIRIHAIREKELPTLDDEFAKDVSEFDTLREYREDILKKMKEQAAKHADEEFKNAVVQAACDNADIQIPACMIETEVDQMSNDQAMRMRQQGIELEQYLSFSNQTMEDFRKSIAPIAEVRVKSDLVLAKISEELNIEVTTEDIDSELERIAAQYGMEKDELAQRISGNDGFIRESIVTRKTIDRLAEEAVKEDLHKEPKKKATAKASPAKKTAEKAPAKKKPVKAENPVAEAKTTAAQEKPAAKKTASKKAAPKKKPSAE
ncbi:MAG: trigger factor [Clostridiaceae bacterium]|nr:trigger factor [Clostridiaceae bacterium]